VELAVCCCVLWHIESKPVYSRQQAGKSASKLRKLNWMISKKINKQQARIPRI
jgi:hypothetical protein